ncbi:MAG TPA: Gfo/Idh/MocA family oxidoreductase [Mycobacteriales bacterium]|jgi:myo-inositol 2-dehydrogenase/D-chiro-inositol 1-dehydrogenase
MTPGRAPDLGIGVIGTGNIGSDHVRRLAAEVTGVRVVAVFDVDTDRAAGVAAGVGARVHAAVADVIGDPAVDAVVIASPGDTHAELVLACLTAAKPVLCEKPLATTAKAALEVVEAEAASGRRLVQVGFMRRYDRGYRRVKATVDARGVGEPLLMHCVHRNAAAPGGATSEMVLTDSVVHEVDAARWLLGQEITAATVVRTRRSPLAAGHLRDPQLVLLETGEGVVVDVEVFVNCGYGYDVRCEVVGATGTVSLGWPATGTLTTDGVRARGHVPADWRERFGTAYREELRQWADGLHRGVVRGPSAWDGYAASAVAEACVGSLATGRRAEVSTVDRPPLYDREGP